MAKAKHPHKKSKDTGDSADVIVNICLNRRARFDYEISEPIECGIALVGTEVKSCREGQTKLDESYGKIENGEAFLVNAEIPEYTFGNRLNHKPRRQRKLLIHRREIAKYEELIAQKGFTFVPLKMYFKNGKAKVEMAVGKGKQNYDKRQSLKTAEAKRDISRAIAANRRKR
jgi:SsrA-binding protein